MSTDQLRIRLTLFTLVLAVIAFGTQVQVSHAATILVVDDDGQGIAGDCDDTTVTYSTISAAQAAAVSGDTIQVCPGTYTSVSQNSISLNYVGPNAGVDPNTDTRGAEAIINLSGAVYRTGAGDTTTLSVSWDGFTFENVTFDDYTTNNDNISLTNNIVQGNSQSFFAQLGTLTLEHNLFQNTTGTTNDLIFGTATTVSITDNTFSNLVGQTNGGAINLNKMSGTITRNRFVDINYYAILIADAANNLDITDNYFEGVLSVDSNASRAAIRFYNANVLTGEVLISGNNFVDNIGGVGIRTGADLTTTGSYIVIEHNRFFNNTNAIIHDGTALLTAENNWFGCNAGPTSTDCDPVNATTVNASIDFTPWLVLTASAQPSTVGTGGNAVVSGEITSNSDGVDAGGAVPDGTTMSFVSILGTLSDATDETVSGVASSTFTAGGTFGSNVVTVTADNQSVSTLNIGNAAPDDDEDDDGGSRGGGAPPAEQPAGTNTYPEGDVNQGTNGAITAGGNGSGILTTLVVNGEGNFAAVGDPNLISQGVVQAVDVFMFLPGGQMATSFEPPVQVCLRGTGSLYFRPAADQTGTFTPVGGYAGSPGYVCVSLSQPGMLVLVGTPSSVPAASSVPASTGQSTPLTNCQVTTEFTLRLRSEPNTNSTILDRLPVDTTVNASEMVDGWYRVVFGDQQGWVSADYISTSGNC